MMVAYAGHLSGRSPLNTNQQQHTSDSMTLTSKSEANNCIKLIQLDKYKKGINEKSKSA
jgi:hypothetical protein